MSLSLLYDKVSPIIFDESNKNLKLTTEQININGHPLHSQTQATISISKEENLTNKEPIPSQDQKATYENLITPNILTPNIY